MVTTMPDTEIPQDVRELAEHFISILSGAMKGKFDPHKILQDHFARAILADRAAHPDTGLLREAAEALRPFADVTVEYFNDWCPDETAAWYRSVDGFDAASAITVGDFRRALAALSAIEASK